MLSGTVPFKGNDLNELNNLILKGKFNDINDISVEAKNLIKNILEVDPKKRLSINEILCHPWLINVDCENNFNYNLFNNSERILLAKSNVDHPNINNKDDMIENFDIRNLDTEEEFESKNINTKSFILAPFNSSIILVEEDDYFIYNNSDKSLIDNYNNEILIKNNIIKFSVKVKELNRIYELNNNGEIDNGVVISMDSMEKKLYNNISPYNNNSFYSKGISPNNEIDDNIKDKDKNKFLLKNNKNNKNDINENILNQIYKLGYSKNYVRDCLNNHEKNYATTSYFLMVKYNN